MEATVQIHAPTALAPGTKAGGGYRYVEGCVGTAADLNVVDNKEFPANTGNRTPVPPSSRP
jgi:hypothetical protein